MNGSSAIRARRRSARRRGPRGSRRRRGAGRYVAGEEPVAILVGAGRGGLLLRGGRLGGGRTEHREAEGEAREEAEMGTDPGTVMGADRGDAEEGLLVNRHS